MHIVMLPISWLIRVALRWQTVVNALKMYVCHASHYDDMTLNLDYDEQVRNRPEDDEFPVYQHGAFTLNCQSSKLTVRKGVHNLHDHHAILCWLY